MYWYSRGTSVIKSSYPDTITSWKQKRNQKPNNSVLADAIPRRSALGHGSADAHVRSGKEAVNDQLIKSVQDELDRIETEECVRVLYACESGSRAWGFVRIPEVIEH